MGRPAKLDRDEILETARGIVAESGPSGLTVAGLCERLGVPVGSIYHRYASRDVLLADLWIRTVESFQPEFLRRLEGPEPIEAALGAVGFASAWVRERPGEARLLLLHRREDFARGEWPEAARRSADRLRAEADRALRAYCRRLCGRVSAASLRGVQLALLDFPLAAFRRSIEAGSAPPRDLDPLVRKICAAALREVRNPSGARP